MVLFSGVIGHRRFRPADVYPIVQLLVVDPRTHARTFYAPTINIYTWQIWIDFADDILFHFQYYWKTYLFLVATAVNGGGNWKFNNNITSTTVSRISSRSLIADSNLIKQ